MDTDGKFTYSEIVEINTGDLTSLSLEQNYTNPINPSTKIRFTIPSVNGSEVTQSLVNLRVYDVLGNEVAELVNEIKPPGNYEIEFNADQLLSEIYFYQLRAADYFQTRKTIITK